MRFKALNPPALAGILAIASIFPSSAQNHRENEYKRVVASDVNYTNYQFGARVAASGKVGIVLAAGPSFIYNPNFVQAYGKYYFIQKDADGYWNIVGSYFPPGQYEATTYAGVSLAASDDFVAATSSYLGSGSSAPQVSIFKIENGSVTGPLVRNLYYAPYNPFNDRLPVAMTNDHLIAANLASYSEKVYIYGRNVGGTDNWGEVLHMTDGLPEFSFGYSVAIDGTTAAVGAPEIGGGLVHVYEKDLGGADTWGEAKVLSATVSQGDERYGEEIIISGDVLAVGALNDDNQGSVHIYYRNQGGANNWGFVKKLWSPGFPNFDHRFGIKLSITDGNLLAVAASGNDDMATNAGAVYFFGKDQGGTNNWGHINTIYSTNPVANEGFGAKLSIGDDEMFVGIPGANGNGGNSGSIEIRYKDSNGPNTWQAVMSLLISDAISYDHFGKFISADGDILAIGTSSKELNSGLPKPTGARIYSRNKDGLDNWAVVKRLPVAAYPFDKLALQGERLAARHSGFVTQDVEWDPESGYHYVYDDGLIRIYSRNEGGTDQWEMVKEIQPGTGNGYYGQAMDIHDDILAVSTMKLNQDYTGDTKGKVLLYSAATNFGLKKTLVAVDAADEDYFGWDLDISATMLAVGATGDDDRGSGSGSIYIFQKDNGGANSWGYSRKITPTDGAAGDAFGTSVKVSSSDLIAVGAPGDDANIGSVYIYNQAGSLIKKVRSPGVTIGFQYGKYMAFDGNSLVVAGIGQTAFVHLKNQGGPDNWGFAYEIARSNGTSDEFAYGGLAISGNTAIVGDDSDSFSSGTRAGAAFMFYIPPISPVAIAATTPTQTSFTANWNAVPDSEGYYIDVSTDNFASFVPGYQDLSVAGSATSKSITGLTGGTTYQYRVRSASLVASSANSNVIGVITAPAATTTSAGTGVTTSQFSANWTVSPGAASYLLDVSSDNFSSFVTGFNAKSVTAQTALVNGLTAGTNYQFRVRAVNSSGSSGNSNTTSVLTTSTPPVLSTATSITVNSFEASWAVVPTATGYFIDVSPDDFTTFVSGFNNLPLGNVLTKSVGALNPGTSYSLRVRAWNGSGMSDHSNVVTLTTLQIEPAAQPTAIQFNNILTTSLDVSFDAATGAPDGYLVLRKSGSSPTDTPLDGVAYTAGQTIGSSTVVYSGTATGFANTQLSQGVNYFYAVFSYKGSGASTNYRTPSPLEGDVTTLVVEPASQSPAVTFSSVTTSSMKVTVAPADDSPSGYLVLMRAGSSPQETPVDGTIYTLSSNFGTSTIVSNSSAVELEITGLSPSTVYHFDVFSYNGEGVKVNYKSSNPTEASRITLAPEPASQSQGPILFANIKANSLTLSFPAAAGNPAGYLVLQRAEAASSESLTDGTAYAINTTVGESTVVGNGPSISLSITGLSAGTVYHYAVYSYNGSDLSLNYLASSPLSGNSITVPPAPIAQKSTNIIVGSFTPQWAEAKGAKKYELEVSKNEEMTDLLPGFNPLVLTKLEAAVEGLSNTGARYYYRVTAVNDVGRSLPSNVENALTPTGTSNGPQKLEITNPVATSSKFSVTTSNGSGTRVVKFYSRGIMSNDWSSEEVTATTGNANLYEVAYTQSQLDDLGLEVYFTAKDVTLDEPKVTSSVYVYKSIPTSTSTIPNLTSGGEPGDWRIFSIPFKLEHGSVGEIFGAFGPVDDTKWRIVQYQGGENVDLNAFSQVQHGQGYWFNAVETHPTSIGTGTSPDFNQSKDFVYALAKGWNLIGAPFPFDIGWESVRAKNNVAVSKLVVFDPSTATLQASTTAKNLKAWSGGFVFADDATIVRVPVTINSSTSRTYELSAGDIAEQEWFVPLTLHHGIAENKMIGVGMSFNASAGKDKLDEITVPRFMNYLEMDVHHPEFFAPYFTRDMVPVSDQHTWSFNVYSSFDEGPAVLTWDPGVLGNNEASLLLFDEDQGTFTDMKRQSAYKFVVGKKRSLRILYSRDNNHWDPGFTFLGAPHPNPSSADVNIPVSVQEDDTQITIEILDMTGRMIARLPSGTRSKGLYTQVWDATAASGERVPGGLYLLRMSTNKSQQVMTQKIIIR